MKRQTLKTALLSLVMLLSLTTMAQNGTGPQNGRSDNDREYNQERQSDQIIRMLNLDEAQQIKMNELRVAHQKAVLPLRNQKQELKAKLQTLSSAEKADMNAINKTIDEISSIENKLMKEKATHHQNIRTMLSEEQRLRFDMHCQNRGRGQGQGKGNGYGNGHGNGNRSGNASCPYNN